MRTLHTALAAAALATAGALPAAASAAAGPAATTQIYQQRTADGRILLTDRPSPMATTERQWQMSPEDAAAARQRALDVKLEAQAVTERVQRSIERQRPGPAVEMRANSQRLALANEAEDEVSYGGGVLISPYFPGGGSRGRDRGFGNRGGYGGYGSFNNDTAYAQRPIGLGETNRLNSYHGARPSGPPRGNGARGPAAPGSR